MYFKGIEEVKQRLLNDKATEEARLAAWEAVSIAKKKDGSEFSQVSRAVSGAKYDTKSCPADSDHPYLFVCFSVGYKYESEWLWAYNYLDELPDSDPRKADYKRQFVRQTCPKTAEELREAVQTRIAQLKADIAETEDALAKLDDAYAQFCGAMRDAENNLKHFDNRHLYYAVKDAVSY